ncbi:hypothetical protein MalM25_31870 [Planctomycetes bacterium MalM25]|nr:hypothetical protein MalM25_31870 [Planctomycetes bacterium MalM25]
MSDAESNPTPPGPLEAYQRRVLGVLVEKAKTTPDAYPLSLNALRSGCNQKSNRFPKMELDEDQIERTVDSLRAIGALTVVQGDSRVERFRHRLYDWLGVEKAELAVVAELLLRGAQTVGDLRGRAARMEPIAGMSELRPILDSLVAKGLVRYLTPPGRGAVVAHTCYSEKELARVLRDLGVAGEPVAAPPAAAPPAPGPAPVAPPPPPAPAPPTPPADDLSDELAELREELTAQISELRDEVERLKQRVEG